ncbi:MAG: phosphodiester glycosidase family protein, partial [Clostridia bacterium]|nr:phosphodiester glycosidase family protein [Clostridia bacterium]
MKKIICLILLLVFSFNLIVTSASGLYSNYFIKKQPLSVGLDYLNYKGEDSSAYSQNVHILDYSPSTDTLPIVSFGKSQLSHKTVSSMVKNKAGAVAGVNGDFFSFTTGIPLSAVISDGIVLSSDAGNSAMGITEDLKVIFGKPEIKISISHSYIPTPEAEESDETSSEIISDETTEPSDSVEADNENTNASTDGTPVDNIPSEETESVISEEETIVNEEITTDGELDTATATESEITESEPEISEATEPEPITLDFSVYYNKYPTVYAVYMTDSSYSDSTASKFNSLEIVVKGDKPVKIGEEIVLTVEDVLADTMNTAIPEDAMVITVPNVLKGYDSYKAIKKGDTLKMTVTSAEGWESVKTAVGGTDIFVKDGAFVPETVDEDHEKYRNARTAVGLREDGSLFFVAVDGDGKSGAGMSMSALGEFMIGEGAVTAFNLDGDGSTTVAVSFPSENEVKVLNSVKDKSERRVSNCVLFINNSSASEDIGFADLGLSDSYLLAGSSLEIKPTLFTKSRNPFNSEYSVTYKASTEGTTVDNGIYKPLDATYNERIFATFVIDGSVLEADGYIRKESGAGDGRFKHIVITELG